MATSGSLNTSAYDGRYLQLAWERTGENIAANTSTLHWTLTGAGSAGSSWYYAGPFTVVIDGRIVFSGGGRIQLYNGTDVASGNITISHNPDGSRSFSASVSAAIYSSSANVSGSDSWSLDDIPRASVPTLSASSLTMGGTIRINTNTASSSFHHKVRYVFGGAAGSQTDFLDYDSSKGFAHMVNWTDLTPPVSLASRVPNATYGTCTVYLKTYSDSSFSTQVGDEQSVSFRLDVPASVVPTISSCTVSPVNSNAWISGKGIYVAGYTKARVQTSAAGAYGSTIRSVSITLDGRSYTGADITSELLQTAGSLTASITVTDTRGRTASTTRSITVQPYASPAISSLAYQRGTYSGGAWTANDNGEDIKVTFTLGLSLAAYSNVGAITASCTGEDNQTTANAAAGAKTYYFTTIGVDNTRTVTVSVTDSVGVTASKSVTVATVEVPLNIDAPNNRIAIGGIAEKDKTLQVKWPAEFTGGFIVNGGFLQSTANGNTVTIGSQNAGLCHFRNSAGIPFYFNKDVLINGDIYPYSTAVQSCGTSAYPWDNTYTKALTLNGSAVADFVVGSGWSGSWFYHIYKSKFCEAWCYIHLTNVAITNAWGYLYESTSYRPPENLALNFSAMRRMTIECAGADAGILSVEVSGWEGANYPAYHLTRADSATVANVYLVAHAGGYNVVP